MTAIAIKRMRMVEGMKIPEIKTTLASMPCEDGEETSVEENETQFEFGAELRLTLPRGFNPV